MGREAEVVFREGRIRSVTLRGALQPTATNPPIAGNEVTRGTCS